MAISLAQLTRANAPKPPRILIHGVAGVGKTTFAAEANNPVFVQTEDGLGTIPAANFPLAALTLWRQYIDGLNALRDDRGMTVVQIAHTDIKRFDSPEHDPYDRYVIKLHTRAAALMQEHSDIVLFANYRISTVKADVGFNKKVNRAMGSGERVIHTAERPAFLAKNRYGLPETLPLDWQSFAQAMPDVIKPMLITNPVTPTNPTT